jgi:RND family efflux transporter MFP subunit
MVLRKKRYVKAALITIGILAIAGSLVGLRATQANKKEEPKKELVMEFVPADVATVDMRSLAHTLNFSGSLMPLLQPTVRSKVTGEVRKVMVREGDRVAEGQVIATVDTQEAQARLDAQVAALEEAKAKLSIAEKNRENNRQLLRQKFISQNAFDTTESTFEASAASMRSAEAQVRLARKSMDDAVIRSPMSGIVSRKMVNVGDKVAVDSQMFTVVDLSRMEIEAPAPASEVPGVKAGQGVKFRVDGFGDRQFEGHVERINPTAEPGSRAILIYISVANHDGALKGGMFAKGEIALDKAPKTMVIPATALREEAGQAFVFTIEDGKIARRAVTVGLREEQVGLVEVKDGLQQGAAVVAARVSGLKVGTPAVIKAPAPAVPAKEKAKA